MNTFRVLHLITTIEKGGAEHAISTLALAQVEAGYEVTVMPLKGKAELKEYLEESDVNVNLSLIGKSLYKQVKLLRKFPDEGLVIHAHLPRSEILARLVWGKGRVVFTRHNSERFIPNGNKSLSRWLSRWVTQSAHVIAISEAVRDFIFDAKEVGSESKVSVIHYGYKRRYPRIEPKRPNRHRHAIENNLQLGTVSRLAAQKNIPLLINLARHLLNNKAKFSLSIVGDGPDKSNLELLSKNLGLENNVHFLGRLKDVSGFLNRLDIFLLTSNYEGFGLVLLEAIDHGLPIIAANTSAIPEVLGREHPGLFTAGDVVSLEKKVNEFLNQPELREWCIDYQHRRLAEFTVSRYFELHQLIYKEVLERNLG